MRSLSAQHLTSLLDLPVDSAPGYRELADRVRMLVLDGRLSPGSRLPSERELTAALPISRTTVTRAYGSLRERGFVTSRQGSGSFVALPHGATHRRSAPPAEVGGDTIGWTVAAGPAAPGVGRAYVRAVELLPDHLGRSGYVTGGLVELRDRVAARYAERGVETDPEQIVITSGAMSALTLVVRSLGENGERVVVDSPTYPNAIESLRRNGLRTIGVPMSGGNWDLDAFEAVLAQLSPPWSYLMPDFHNPTGTLMPDEQRARLAAMLVRAGTIPIVDESMCELALDPAPSVLPFAAHAPRAISIGSTSKSFWGGLRVGWIRAPLDLVPRLVHSRGAYDLGSAVLEQLVASELLRDRTAVLADRLQPLRERRARLQRLLGERLPTWSPNRPTGGLSLWVGLPGRLSTRVALAAETHDLFVTAGSRFFVGTGGERWLRLPYTLEPHDLDEAVGRLALAWDDVRFRVALSGEPMPAPLTA